MVLLSRTCDRDAAQGNDDHAVGSIECHVAQCHACILNHFRMVGMLFQDFKDGLWGICVNGGSGKGVWDGSERAYGMEVGQEATV